MRVRGRTGLLGGRWLRVTAPGGVISAISRVRVAWRASGSLELRTTRQRCYLVLLHRATRFAKKKSPGFADGERLPYPSSTRCTSRRHNTRGGWRIELPTDIV